MSKQNMCPECNEYRWCKPCNSKHFQNNFNNWTSGNDKIDKFIQDAQLNADYHGEVIEWIPYDRFKDLKQIGRGGFETIYYARWIDGKIKNWDSENQQWERYGKSSVALKKFDNFVDFNDVLNEMEIHLKTLNGIISIRFYGITQDPETHSYMMVLEYAKDGNLREYLKINFNNINWLQKLDSLWNLSYNLMNIHKLDIVHQDFHPGNILSANFKSDLQISDYGLKVLSGDEGYSKAADVYSFGIIAYEIVTGFPPYPDIPHDQDLAMNICNGLRPKIPFHTPKLITRTIMRCWDARVTHRPTFEELNKELYKYYDDYRDYLDKEKNKDSEIVIQIKKVEELSANQNYSLRSIWKNISHILVHWGEESSNTVTSTTTTHLNYQTHPEAIYTSRLINYSSLPKPKNEEIFEKELEELTQSTSASSAVRRIFNGLRPKIPFHSSKLITRMIIRCWDAQVTYRPTFKELDEELT
ncbi:hypothetical protein Glove_320g37 [Diversispora epigaea]|uniref:Protein kinase domain-containing protein n=1 Tax=Diversispora epigaea TaxID=1348612 RepID=A0A397HNP5_9GLOM|nr:hypothetical protein Glove_320g37 [Diversispora epigaea]